MKKTVKKAQKKTVLMSAESLSPMRTPAGQPVFSVAKTALTDPTVIAGFLVGLYGALTMFVQGGLLSLVVKSTVVLAAINGWLLLVAGIILIILRVFFGKNPVTLKPSTE